MELSLIVERYNSGLRVDYRDGVYSVGEKRFDNRTLLVNWILDNMSHTNYTLVSLVDETGFAMEALSTYEAQLPKTLHGFTTLLSRLRREGSSLTELCIASLESAGTKIEEHLLPERFVDRRMKLRISTALKTPGLLKMAVEYDGEYLLTWTLNDSVEKGFRSKDPAEVSDKIRLLSTRWRVSDLLFFNEKRKLYVPYRSYSIDRLGRAAEVLNSSMIEALRRFVF